MQPDKEPMNEPRSATVRRVKAKAGKMERGAPNWTSGSPSRWKAEKACDYVKKQTDERGRNQSRIVDAALDPAGTCQTASRSNGAGRSAASKLLLIRKNEALAVFASKPMWIGVNTWALERCRRMPRPHRFRQLAESEATEPDNR